MTELRITRSGDILLYIGEEQLFGVIDFQARAVYDTHMIREYLSGEAHAIVNAETAYEIRMSVLSLFRFAVLETEGFILRVEDGEVVYCYEGCTVTKHDRDIKAGKTVVDEFVISAKRLRKQVREDGV